MKRLAVIALLLALTLGGATASAAQGVDHQGRKSPALALALSVILPGAGQVYNGDYLKGAAMFGGVALTVSSVILTTSDVLGLDDDTSDGRTHALGAVGVGLILWAWIDAPLSARSINRRLDAGGMGLNLDLGPRIEASGTGAGIDLSLFRIGF